MRALWTGSLNFGLINIPVKLYSATEERGGIELDYLHRKDLTPIKYVRVCTHDGTEIPFEDVVKGFEYKEGMYITLEEEDFERANLRATQTIDIHEFTEEASIDPLYYDKPYFLMPAEGGERSYALLQEALKRTGKAGIVTFVLRGRGRLGFIKAEKHGIVLQRLRFPVEVRDPALMDVPHVSLSEKETDVAVALVEFLTQPFSIQEYRDTYTEELRRVIDEKIRGETGEAEAQKTPEPTKPADLMKLLRASLNEGKKGKSRFSAPSSAKQATVRKTQPKRAAVKRTS